MKKIIVTEEQFNNYLSKEIDEATATSNAGNYAYDVPFGGDKETRDHKNLMQKSFTDYGKKPK